jgi:sorting nexin-1/2
MSADVGDAERRVNASRLLFEDMGRLMRSELERFEREKVEDFKSGVETFLEGAVEAQKEVSLNELAVSPHPSLLATHHLPS